MKATLLFFFSLTVLVAASPLGNRALFNKHNAADHTRRYILQSRLDSPPACAALSGTDTTLPDVSNSTTPFVNSTSIDNNATTTDNSTLTDPSTTNTSALPDPTAADNSTLVDPTAADNSTSALNTTSLESSSRRRRFWRRVAQDDLPDVALGWQRLCLVSGGDIFTDDPCVKLAGIDGINALLVNADPCAQQDNADAMITFAKSAGVNNTDELIANAIAYRKHPRNTVDILGVVPSTPYCQRAPVNPELNGLVNEQLEGVDPGLFGSPGIPIVPFGAPGTCPFGLTPDVATCSCVNGTDASGTSTATADNSTATNISSDTSATTTTTSLDGAGSTSIDVSNSTATSNSASASATASGSGPSSSTDIATSSASVGISSVVSVTGSTSSTLAASGASSSTTSVTSTASATPAATVSAPAATKTKNSGPNIQPDDISGDVNDVNG